MNARLAGNMLHAPKAETELTTHRIESFSDGVFAIAITLLVLEIKVPHSDNGNARDLASDLLQLWPSYFAYIFSFVTFRFRREYWRATSPTRPCRKQPSSFTRLVCFFRHWPLC